MATRDDLARAAEDMPDELTPEFIDEALTRGDLCTAAFEEDTMVSFMWRSFSTAPHDGLWVSFEKPYRYGYKAYTKPEYRGRHLQSPIAYATDQYCLEIGRTHALSIVETHNYPSISSDMGRGNELVGFAGYFRAFGWVLPFRTRGAQKHSFRFELPTANFTRSLK